MTYMSQPDLHRLQVHLPHAVYKRAKSASYEAGHSFVELWVRGLIERELGPIAETPSRDGE